MNSKNNLQVIFEKTVNQFSFPKSSTFLISVSGGVDSMVLLDLFRKSGKKIGVFHFNHQTRPDENENELKLVKKYCSKQEIPFYAELWKVKSKTGNFQEKARNERKKRLLKTALQYKYDFIATAHHSDDQIETQLQRIFKGASLTNLSAMSVLEDIWFKPLLAISKKDILKYAKLQKLKFLEDSSNLSDDYERNWLRHHIIPELKEQFTNRLTSSFQNLSQQSSLLKKNASEFYQTEKENVIKLHEDGFEIEFSNNQPYFESFKILFLKQFFEDHFKLTIGFQLANEIFQFSNFAARGKLFEVSQKIRIRKLVKTILVFNNNSVKKRSEEPEYRVLISKAEKPKIISPGNKIIIADKEKTDLPLTVRFWKNGDKFQPLGLKQKIKLSDFFINRKIELHQKKSVPLIVDNAGNIIWIYGIEINDIIKVTNKTSQFIKIELEGV